MDAMSEVRVLLRDTVTGEEAWYSYSVDDEYAEGQEFYWSDGNGGCDCNRGSCLASVLGKADPNLPCGESRIALLRAEVNGIEQSWADRPVDDPVIQS